jgi:hypothetical protein
MKLLVFVSQRLDHGYRVVDPSPRDSQCFDDVGHVIFGRESRTCRTATSFSTSGRMTRIISRNRWSFLAGLSSGTGTATFCRIR